MLRERRCAVLVLSLLSAAACRGQVPAVPQPLPGWQTLHRVPLPEALPPHPRVFCTQADIDRIRADYAAGDVYTVAAVNSIVAQAEALLTQELPTADTRPTGSHFAAASRLAEAYVVSGDERFGRRALAMLVPLTHGYMKLETTRSRGRVGDSTLAEGPIVVNAANAYDLIAAAPWVSDADRTLIENELLRTMAWESGHRGGHMNSSNWRSWGLTALAAGGFASGDRALIDEAINGVWDPDRNAYLYGIVQQLAHSIFADGIHWERSIGYTYYTASALMYVLEAARNSGIDLWHADLPGILGPFQGGAPHEEYGPEGNRSMRAFLDAPFYYAFPDGSFARIGDSGTRSIHYHPIYELAWSEYADPKYAWLIRRQRDEGDSELAGWSLWRPAGEPEAAPAEGRAGQGYRLKTGAKERAALVQNVVAPADQPVRVSAWVKALAMDGGSAHLRINVGDEAVFTDRVREAGDWREVSATLPPAPGAQPGERRTLRLHVFLEGGAGEVIWDDIAVVAEGSDHDLALNGSLDPGSAGGRGLDFWSLVHSPAEVPAGQTLTETLTADATIGLVGRHVAEQTLFPIGGFAILRADAADLDAPAALLEYGPYGSGHDHPDRLHLSVYGRGAILAPDAGSWGYDDPMHLTWANTTTAHNTLTVDEIPQWPQNLSKSIWAGESGDRRAFGVLRLFHPGERLKAMRATCDTVYEGVTMDRTTCLVGGYLVDVFRAEADADHTFDLALHGLGAAVSDADLTPLADNPFEARGYAHLTNLRRGRPTGTVRVDFGAGAQRLTAWQPTPAGGEIILADDPERGTPTAALIARRTGRSAVWVTVLEPHAGTPTVTGVDTAVADGDVTVTVTHAAGQDRLTLPAALDGAVVLTGASGEETAAP